MADEWISGLTLLPDEAAIPRLRSGIGPVRATDAQALWHEAAKCMRAPRAASADLLSVRTLLRERLAEGDTAAWRGALAAALLADTWDCTLFVREGLEGGPLADGVRLALDRESLPLLILDSRGTQALLGIADAELGLIPPARERNIAAALPARVTWYDRAAGVFADPVEQLGSRDRLILRDRLRALEGCAATEDFIRAIEAREARIAEASLHEDAEAWSVRVRAAALLQGEEGYEALTVTDSTVQPGGSPLLLALGLPEPPQPRRDDRTWCWHGTAFARSSESIGLEPAGSEGESDAISALAGELELLEQYSPRMRRQIPEKLAAWTQRCGQSLSAEHRQLLEEWQRDASGHANRPCAPLELNFPRNDDGPAAALLLRELLGNSLAEAAAQPFSPQLCLTADGDMGDERLNQSCGLLLGERAWLAVPPVSEGLAEYTARHGWSGHGLQPGSVRLTARASGSAEVAMTIIGEGAVTVRRLYRPEEMLRLEAAPCVAVWPCIPMEDGRWRAYYLSLKDTGAKLLRGGRWESASGRVELTDSFPRCVSLQRDGVCVGALLCQAALCHPGLNGAVVIGLDAGLSGIALAMELDGTPQAVEIPSLWRVLLRGSADSPEQEPLPVWPVGPVLPSAVLPPDGGGEPLTGGMLCPEERMDSDRPRFACEDTAPRQLAIRQAMLCATFHAVMHGAQSVSWRAALPVSGEERELALLRACAAGNERLTSVPQTVGRPLSGVRSIFADALFLKGAMLAGSSFALLDLGAGSSQGGVWLWGMDRPALEWRADTGLLTGMQQILSARPSSAVDDFGEAGRSLCLALEASRNDPAAREQSLLMLERLLGAHAQETMDALRAQNQMGCFPVTQAALLLLLAARLTAVGLSLEKISRDSMLRDHLPADLPLHLLGRGSRLFGLADEGCRAQLAQFLHLGMSAGHPVRALHMTLSGFPKQEAARGLCFPPQLPLAQPLETDAKGLMPLGYLAMMFLAQFCLLLPQSAAALFPGWFCPNGALTPEAEQRVAAAAGNGTEDGIPAFLRCIGDIASSPAAL